jgi:hypothetical protein
MTTTMCSHSFENTASMFAPDMKGLHVIEFITNDQPYPAEKVKKFIIFFLYFFLLLRQSMQ